MTIKLDNILYKLYLMDFNIQLLDRYSTVLFNKLLQIILSILKLAERDEL